MRYLKCHEKLVLAKNCVSAEGHIILRSYIQAGHGDLMEHTNL